MQYDLILWFIMFTLWWFNRNSLITKLPTLILCSNFINLLVFNMPDGAEYYYAEGLRHTTTIILIHYLYNRERYTDYYLSYFIVYAGIATLYLASLFVVLSNFNIDIIGVTLNTLEFMVFTYGILFIKSHYSCPDNR